jgi:UDP-glucose 4-epimerase
MTKVLVTGGVGFVGSNTVNELVNLGYDVVVVDNLVSGKKEYIQEYVKFYEYDICDIGIFGIVRREQPDFIIHLAAQVNVRKSMKDPILDADTNILGSLHILECCKKYNVKKLIYSSSGGAVYGEPKQLPVSENDEVNPISAYGVSKYCVEKYIEFYHRVYSLDYTILRYSNVFGPNQNPNGEVGVIAIFIGKYLRKERPIIFGDGMQTRDYVYVKDVVNANILALEKNTQSKIFNVSSGVGVSVNKIDNELRALIGTNLKPMKETFITGEVKNIYLDIHKAKRELGWYPKTSFNDGLKETIKWYKETYSKRQ